MLAKARKWKSIVLSYQIQFNERIVNVVVQFCFWFNLDFPLFDWYSSSYISIENNKFSIVLFYANIWQWISVKLREIQIKRMAWYAVLHRPVNFTHLIPQSNRQISLARLDSVSQSAISEETPRSCKDLFHYHLSKPFRRSSFLNQNGGKCNTGASWSMSVTCWILIRTNMKNIEGI